MADLFFFNDTATTEIYTLTLPDALPISGSPRTPSCPTISSRACTPGPPWSRTWRWSTITPRAFWLMPGASTGGCGRSEEHTSELQSQSNLVCRLLLEKKKKEDSQQVTRH